VQSTLRFDKTSRYTILLTLALLAALAIFAYLPTLRLPFVQDGYVEIPIARAHGAQGWSTLWHDLGQRTRFTYMLLSYSLDRVFGFVPLPFYIASIVLHVFCTWLVYASGFLRIIGWQTSLWAACFFAVQDGHQEAVMWTAGCQELFLFLFGFGALLLWMLWLETGARKWFALSLFSFAFALASKESVWIFPALMLLLVLPERHWWKRAALGIIPYAAAAFTYVLWIAGTRKVNGRFADRTFSLSAPWPLSALNSVWHLLVIWGLLAIVVIVICGKWKDRKQFVLLTCAWMILAVLPYSFLTYMARVPSRQTYLASAGLAWLVGAGFQVLRDRVRPVWFVSIAVVVFGINCELLWVKKLSQFRERAEPTELLKAAAVEAAGPVHIQCVPLSDVVAAYAVRDFGSEAILEKTPVYTDSHCFSIWYQTPDGRRVNVQKQLAMQRHGWLW
jgi:hypothetical protein